MQDPNKKVRGKRLTQQDIIQRFIDVHGDVYDYSKVIFTTNNEKVIVICKRHGEFHTTPKRHSKGTKCRKCYLEDTNGKYHKDENFRKAPSFKPKQFIFIDASTIGFITIGSGCFTSKLDNTFEKQPFASFTYTPTPLTSSNPC